MAAALKGAGEPTVIVHGGGSYGHYWSVRHRMHTRPERYGARGVAVVKASMVDLHAIVVRGLLEAGLRPYPLPPAALVDGARADPRGARAAAGIAAAGMQPVTYGDAVWRGGGRTHILSGDRIMGILAAALRPRLCVFALAEDGLYSDPRTRELIREVSGQRPVIGPAGADVTGGMARKLAEARRIARGGTDVFFVNGNRPGRIAAAAAGRGFEGTLFRGRGARG